jgi:peptidoglycan hydrolase-like protein with peptidoglycan-binding domain
MNTGSINYNKDLDPRLFGRESSSGASSKGAAADDSGATQSKPASQQQAAKDKAKDAPEYRITEVMVVVPSDGLKKDQPFDIKGKVKPLVGTLTKTKVRLDLINRYNDEEDKFATVEADIGKDNTFTGTCKQLFFHDGFQRDKEKPEDATFTLEAKASGAGAEKEVVSKTVELPMETSTVILKKGKYDDEWVKGHEATHPKSGKEYVPDTKVKKLQDNLFTFRFLPQGSSDGMFGDQTEAAVKQFQECAGKPERKRADDIKVEKIDKITFDGGVDGIVGEKTEKEIAVWLQNNWVKPDSEFRKGDYDDNGVKNKFGERGGEKHHPGTGITDLQKDLATVKAYKGKIDGIFGEKTEAAVKLFQDKASKGELVDKDGKAVEIPEDERLEGFRSGVGDGPTVAGAKDIAGKNQCVGSSGAELWVRIDINPDSAGKDKFILTSSDGSFSASKTAADDKIPNNKSIDLLFENLDTSLSYTLEVKNEDGSVTLFEKVPYTELASLKGGDAAQEPGEPEEVGEHTGDVEMVNPNFQEI